MDENPYKDMIDKVIRAAERKMTDSEELLKMFTEFHTSASNVFANLSLHKAEHENSRNHMNSTLFFKDVIQYIGDVMLNIDGLEEFIASLASLIVKPLDTFHTKSAKKVEAIQKSFNQAQIALDISEGQYKKQYEEYAHACEILSEEHDPSKIECLRVEVQKAEKAAVHACKSLANVRKSYCFEIEKTFYMYEKYESKYYKLIDSIVLNLAQILQKFSESYKIKTAQSADRINKIRNSNEDEMLTKNMRKTVSHNCDSGLKHVELQFNIFNLLPYEIVYEKIMNAKVCCALESYENRNEIGLRVEQGELLEIKEKSKKTSTIEILSSGIVGKVDTKILGPCQFKRVICKLKQDVEFEGITYHAGFYLCIVADLGTKFRCKTPSGSMINIPKDSAELIV